MKDQALYLLVGQEDHQQRLLFQQALREIRVNTVPEFVHDGFTLLNLLDGHMDPLPHMVFLDMDLPAKGALEYLEEIRRRTRLRDLVVAISGPEGAEKIMQEAFVLGANIYWQRTNDCQGLTGMLSHAISMFWQYYTSGLRRENFLLNIHNHYKHGQVRSRICNSNGS